MIWIFKTNKQQAQRIKELERLLSKAIDDKLVFQIELEYQQRWASYREAILSAFGEMVKNGATELSCESFYRDIDKIHIKREIIK